MADNHADRGHIMAPASKGQARRGDKNCPHRSRLVDELLGNVYEEDLNPERMHPDDVMWKKREKKDGKSKPKKDKRKAP